MTNTEFKEEALKRAREENPEITSLTYKQMLDIMKSPRSNQPFPTLSKQALNFSKAAFSEVKAICNGAVSVTPEIKQHRLDICDICEFRVIEKGKGDRCGKCGCFLNAKTNWRSSACPINKWGPIDI